MDERSSILEPSTAPKNFRGSVSKLARAGYLLIPPFQASNYQAAGMEGLHRREKVEITNLTEAEIENLNAKCDYRTQYAALQYTLGLPR
jgi:hypothetical protein